MFTGPEGSVEVFFYWPEAVLGHFYWPRASGLLLALSPLLIDTAILLDVCFALQVQTLIEN